MDGQLAIIDGEPGTGKTLEAIRRMLADVKAGRNIATNIALRPAFIAKARQIRPGVKILRIEKDEQKEFWKTLSPGYSIYIDEAHLIWLATDWHSNRSGELVAYISQFRKYDDSITLLAQCYENLDRFIRQRTHLIYTCRRINYPLIRSKDGQKKPIIFAVHEWQTRDGERDERLGLPRFYTPSMNRGIYPLYDTRALIETAHGTVTRPTEKPMPTDLTGTTPPPAPTAPQPIVIHNAPAPTPKKGGKLKWVVIGGTVIAAALIFMRPQHHTDKRLQEIQYAQHHKPKKAIWYGTIGSTIYGRQAGHPIKWQQDWLLNGATILQPDEGHIVIREPNGEIISHETWRPPTKNDTSTTTAKKLIPKL